jgi:hypothetical protein
MVHKLEVCEKHLHHISSIDTLDLFSSILSAVGGGGIGAIVADSRLGSSLSKITFQFIKKKQLSRVRIGNCPPFQHTTIYKYFYKKMRK